MRTQRSTGFGTRIYQNLRNLIISRANKSHSRESDGGHERVEILYTVYDQYQFSVSMDRYSQKFRLAMETAKCRKFSYVLREYLI